MKLKHKWTLWNIKWHTDLSVDYYVPLVWVCHLAKHIITYINTRRNLSHGKKLIWPYGPLLFFFPQEKARDTLSTILCLVGFWKILFKKYNEEREPECEVRIQCLELLLPFYHSFENQGYDSFWESQSGKKAGKKGCGYRSWSYGGLLDERREEGSQILEEQRKIPRSQESWLLSKKKSSCRLCPFPWAWGQALLVSWSWWEEGFSSSPIYSTFARPSHHTDTERHWG